MEFIYAWINILKDNTVDSGTTFQFFFKELIIFDCEEKTYSEPVQNLYYVTNSCFSF